GRELVRSVTHNKMGSVALSRCYETQSNLPYAPLTELFRQLIEINSEKITKIPRLWRGELLKILPEFGERFKEIEPNPALSPDQEQARLFEGLTQVLKIFSQDRALLLFVDDWQWADQATLQFFSYLIPRLAQSRIVLLGACRGEEVAGELGALIRQLRHHEAVLDLAGLMELEIKGLVDHLLGAEFPELSRELCRRTEGHPFFILEVLQSLIRARQLRPNAQGRWEWAVSSESSLAIPPEVSGVIETRLRRLDESEWGVLNAAAVVGRTFDPDFLAAVTGHNNSYLLELLDELRQARLIT
ncbi:AAA family ATPase, partial [Candidatus Acetothermia bacterium]|nr:AAA family ATPase [Candidatus Acetothermia bacterium]